MSKIVKNIIALSVSSALSISFIHNVNAATYKIIDTGEVSNLKYTYAQHQNSSGDMAISGTSLYNFPVQFQYLDEDDFNEIRNYALFSFASVHALNDIEDFDALKAGNPTANDLAWVVRWLQIIKSSNVEYQKVGDTVAITNVAGVTEDYNLWDETFAGSGELTRSTADIVSGITDGGISYGTATAPYLPEEPYIDSDGEEHVFWLREYGNRGFFSYDQGAQVHQVVPFEIEYGGGESAVLDANEAGIAVGFSSYKVSQAYIDVIEDDSGGCADTSIVPEQMSLEACIARTQLQSSVSVYHTMALKATLDPSGNPVVEQLGLLVEPHVDDERPHSSYALAVNIDGVAVGYAGGWDDETETNPTVDERSTYQYAVVYKNEEVIDLTGDHADKGGSRAYDINDAGIAVGHLTKVINGKLVQKFFHVDTTVPKDEIELIFPDDFFDGSDSTVRAINNAGLMVGEGEIETHNESTQNPRRTAAFVYNMNDDIFTNLNKLIPCSTRLTYDILEARGINDAGMISATAVVKVDRLDAKGIPMLDDNGSTLTEDVVRAISLEPTPDDGEICTAEEEGKLVRQGAGFGFGSLFALISLFGLRRKFMK
ncbi:MAG: DUF3466 family protein [Colwellia sp.]|nr:DUF3466 family protein [Colwellia sp.]